MSLLRKRQASPAQVIILGFLGLIGAGTLLLMLPFASREPGSAPFLDALFTATSATCVTGLVVQDTATYWTVFGQGVILLLIQIGGMGVVTMAMAIAMVTGQKIGLKERLFMQESIADTQVGGIVARTRFILKVAFAIELAGAAVLAVRFIPRFGPGKGLWLALFHSISAFCNAGFDLMGRAEAKFVSMTDYAPDPLVNITLIVLIVVGGLGFLTWRDLRENRLHWKAYSLQTKLILVTTGVLLAGAFAFYYLYEFRLDQWSGLTEWEKFQGAVFQAVTPRTAGFNTLDLTNISQAGILVMILLMLVGGSPGSTAGGFKTTTLAVLVLSAKSTVLRRRDAACFGRRLTEDTVRNAGAILVLYLALLLTGSVIISCADGLPILTALFEAGSAVATVGLTLGVTPGLSTVSRLVLIFLMYVGRVGSLTMIYAVTGNEGIGLSRYPQEKVAVG